MPNRKRKNQILIAVTDKEKEMILGKFKLSGFKTFTDFCCHMLIYGKIFKINTDELKKISYEINKIGTNINQISQRVNTTGNLYKEDIMEIKNKLLYLNNFVKTYSEVIEKIKETI